MKEDFFDYLTPQEQKKFDEARERSHELVKEIKKLNSARSRTTRKIMQLIEVAQERMKITGR